MINASTANLVLLTFARILAYFPTVTFAGYLQAWIEKKMGDDTGERRGLLSLDPAVHFNPIGFIVMLFMGFGWGNRDSLSPQRCAYFPQHRFGYLICMFARPVAHFILLIAALLIMILLGGLFYQTPVMGLIQSNTILITVVRKVIVVFLELNLISVVLYFAWGMFMLGTIKWGDTLRAYTQHADLLFFILFFAFYILFASYLRMILVLMLVGVEAGIKFLFLLFK